MTGHEALGDRNPWAIFKGSDVRVAETAPRALCGAGTLVSSVLTDSVNGGLEDIRTTAGLLGTGAEVIRTTCFGTGDPCERIIGDAGVS